jgi:hypothetical protein
MKLMIAFLALAGLTWAVNPCCTITRIQGQTVTAQETATGRTFEFSATPAVLSGLRVGQSVYANFTAKQVSVNGANPCCSITNLGQVPSAGSSLKRGIGAAPAAASGAPPPLNPCCSITRIQGQTITAQETATGRTFEFSATGAVLSGLRVGQNVYANFTAKQVSVNGASPCCSITSLRAN